MFEPDTEVALDRIFTRFETDLFIPSADPIKYLTGSVEQRSLLANQRRFFLQRAESSMYALRRTIVNFRTKIELMQSRLDDVKPNAAGLEEFLLLHYRFNTPINPAKISTGVNDKTGEKDAYGLASATANQTPALGRVIPCERSLTELTQLYDRLVKLKQEYLADLVGVASRNENCEETTSDVKTASERLSRIPQRIQRLHLNDLPADISPKTIRAAIGKLDSWKESKVVEKLLRAYNDGEKSQLPDPQFLAEFLTDTDLLNLIDRPKAKKASLKIAVNALLLKV